ncbi:MAG: hypothetical protein WDN69_32140 [Aliidongia sp.]
MHDRVGQQIGKRRLDAAVDPVMPVGIGAVTKEASLCRRDPIRRKRRALQAWHRSISSIS